MAGGRLGERGFAPSHRVAPGLPLSSVLPRPPCYTTSALRCRGPRGRRKCNRLAASRRIDRPPFSESLSGGQDRRRALTPRDGRHSDLRAEQDVIEPAPHCARDVEFRGDSGEQLFRQAAQFDVSFL